MRFNVRHSDINLRAHEFHACLLWRLIQLMKVRTTEHREQLIQLQIHLHSMHYKHPKTDKSFITMVSVLLINAHTPIINLCISTLAYFLKVFSHQCFSRFTQVVPPLNQEICIFNMIIKH